MTRVRFLSLLSLKFILFWSFPTVTAYVMRHAKLWQSTSLGWAVEPRIRRGRSTLPVALFTELVEPSARCQSPAIQPLMATNGITSKGTSSGAENEPKCILKCFRFSSVAVWQVETESMSLFVAFHLQAALWFRINKGSAHLPLRCIIISSCLFAVPARSWFHLALSWLTHTHTHTHTYINGEI